MCMTFFFRIISSIFPRNYEAFTSKFLENNEEIFLCYQVNSNTFSKLKYIFLDHTIVCFTPHKQHKYIISHKTVYSNGLLEYKLSYSEDRMTWSSLVNHVLPSLSICILTLHKLVFFYGWIYLLLHIYFLTIPNLDDTIAYIFHHVQSFTQLSEKHLFFTSLYVADLSNANS